MFQDGKRFCDLVSLFKQLDRPSWFGHDLLVALFKTNWRKTRRYIIIHGLIPFTVYFFSCLLYTEYVASCEEGRCQLNLDQKVIAILGIPMVLMWLYFTYFEIVQFYGVWKSVSIEVKKKKGCCRRLKMSLSGHYSRWWNYIDTYLMLQVPLILVFSIAQYAGIELVSQKLIIWQSLGCQISMWFKLFDWLRLFTITAIYPILLREVLYDIYPFIIMMLIVLGLFGNGIYIFQAMAIYDGHGELYSKHMPFKLLSAVASNVLTLAGEYENEKYSMEDDAELTMIVWFWFMGAILMTQIVFLNILIAIISDTFDRVWDSRQTYILSSQADVLQDWLDVIKHTGNIKKLYMYIIKPTFQ